MRYNDGMLLSVVFPSKNQTAKLLENINEKGLPFFRNLNIPFEFLIVTDGSDEKNQRAMLEASGSFPEEVRLLPYEMHLGKGHNVQKGILAAKGDYVLFMDADFATGLDVLKTMLKDLDAADAWIASRDLSDSVLPVKQGLLRRLMGKVSHSLVRRRFQIGVLDTQCGFKMFRTDLAKEIAKRQIIDGFAFDVEYLYFLSLNGYAIKEYPCVWTDDPDSTVSHPLKSSISFLKELRAIKKNKKAYLLTREEKARLYFERTGQDAH